MIARSSLSCTSTLIDGSAVQSKSWPRKTLSAGWSAVFFNVDPMGVHILVGAGFHSADSRHVHWS